MITATAGLPEKMFIKFNRFDLHLCILCRGCCTSNFHFHVVQNIQERLYIVDIVFGWVIRYDNLIHKTCFVIGVETYFAIMKRLFIAMVSLKLIPSICFGLRFGRNGTSSKCINDDCKVPCYWDIMGAIR